MKMEVSFMKNVKKFFSLFIALSLCMAMAVPAFAAENPKEVSAPNGASYTFEVTSDGAKMVRSNLWGSASKTLTKGGSNNGIFISCDGSGFGGMGITIDTHCSQGNYKMDFAGTSTIGSGSNISGTISTNAHKEFKRLTQFNLKEYMIAFDVPEGVTVSVDVWIYG